MIDPDDPDPPLIDSVFHPSDFSEGSERAFAHALAIALKRQTEFTVFHTDTQQLLEDDWGRYPAIRETLERWGMLPKDSPRSAVFGQLGIRAQKIGVRSSDPTQVIGEYLTDNPADLIVLATRGSEGMPAWLDTSVAEKIARKTESMTLFVPKTSEGFVSIDTGEISLNRILIAVDEDPPSGAAIAFACRAAKLLATEPVAITLLHVGPPSSFPYVDMPSDPAWRLTRVSAEGVVVDAIVDEASKTSPDLIVMTTRGRHGFLDALRGSTTEQIVRRAPCPVLAVPAAVQSVF